MQRAKRDSKSGALGRESPAGGRGVLAPEGRRVEGARAGGGGDGWPNQAARRRGRANRAVRPARPPLAGARRTRRGEPPPIPPAHEALPLPK